MKGFSAVFLPQFWVERGPELYFKVNLILKMFIFINKLKGEELVVLLAHYLL